MRPKPRPRRASKCQGTLGGTQAPQAPALTLAGKPELKVYDSLLGLEHPWPNPAACVPPIEACSNGDRGRRPAQRDTAANILQTALRPLRDGNTTQAADAIERATSGA